MTWRRVVTCAVFLVVNMLAISHLMGQADQEKLWCEYVGSRGVGQGKHIVLIAGDDEYRSEEALPMLGKILAKHLGFRCTVLFPVNDDGKIQPNHQTNIPGMKALDKADLVILGLRFRNLPDDQMRYFDDYLKSGKPVVAVRTTTHAFRIPKDSKYARYSFNYRGESWTGGFGQQVLGDTWVNHHGDHGSESTRGVINQELKEHPILRGVKDVWGPTDVYEIKRLPSTAKVLLHGQVLDGMTSAAEPVDNQKNDPMMPLAWVKSYKTESGKVARVFCTTMGAASDFESPGLRRLIVNAALWGLGMESKIEADSDVSIVGKYAPTPFGFGNFKTGTTPADYAWANNK